MPPIQRPLNEPAYTDLMRAFTEDAQRGTLDGAAPEVPELQPVPSTGEETLVHVYTTNRDPGDEA